MKTSQSFPFYPTDFLMGTMFLSTEEVGAYIRLLCYQWQEGKIPENSENLKKISGISRKKLENVLKKFQRYEENSEFFLVNDRLEVVRCEREQFIEIQRANGKKGGRPPKQKQEGLENPRVSQHITQTKPELTLPSPSPSPSPSPDKEPPNPQGGKKENEDEKIRLDRMPTQDEIHVFCETLFPLTQDDGEYLFNHWSSNGFTRANKPIKNWQATIRAWIAAGHLPVKQFNGRKHEKQATGI